MTSVRHTGREGPRERPVMWQARVAFSFSHQLPKVAFLCKRKKKRKNPDRQGPELRKRRGMRRRQIKARRCLRWSRWAGAQRPARSL